MTSQDAYFSSRFINDHRRDKLWKALIKHFFQRRIGQDRVVLEIGAGRCEFINALDAKKKIAIDNWEGICEFSNKDIEVFVTEAWNLDAIQSDTIDFIFASNLVEHLTKKEFELMLTECDRILKNEGTLCLLQPNFKYSYKNYFDDFTHISIWTHESLKDFLVSKNWVVTKVRKKFLPLTLKSRFPVSSLLIKLYLISPIKPFSGQMLIEAKKII